MISDSLASLHVLVTRPIEQQQTLTESIEGRGGEVLSLPLIAIAPLQHSSEIQAVSEQIQNLDNYQILIFVSSNAAKFGAEIITNYWPQFPVGLNILAIGPTTAKCLSSLLDADIIQADTGMTSEDLLKLPLLNDVSDKRIAIVRGQGGRELLAATLRARGASVDYLETYRRITLDYAGTAFCDELKAADINVLTVTSSQALDRLQSLLNDNKEEMSLLPLLVPSERILMQAREFGFNKVVNTNGADPKNFLIALETLASNK